MPASIAVSVVICTRNRADKLRMALQSLEDMSVPADVLWEVVVVDNNSTDNTQEVTRSFAKGCDIPVKCVLETQPGVSFARNKGIEASSGEIIASIDDDCIVTEDWLVNILEEFREDKSLGILGGMVELYDERDQPISIRLIEEKFTVTSPSQIFYSIPGCNIAYTRKVAERIGGFDTRFGPGTPTLSADDSDFLYRSWHSGHKLVYDPKVRVYHNHGRRSDVEVRNLRRVYVISRGAFYFKFILMLDMNVIKLAYWELRTTLADLLRHLASREEVVGNFGIIKNLGLGAAYFVKASIANSGSVGKGG